jgi:hypothetical protein
MGDSNPIKSVTLTFTLRELDALLHAIISSDVRDEPEEYDEGEVKALERVEKKVRRAITLAAE